jgi:RNA recognition motif-containing protein
VYANIVFGDRVVRHNHLSVPAPSAEENLAMLKKLFVGSLPWSVGDNELEDLFRDYGTVQSARVITDRETGRSRGFGFVEIETDDLAAIIRSTDGQEVEGRAIRVNEAEEKSNSRGGGGGNRGGFGGNRGGSGGGGGGYGRRGRYWV